VGCTEVTKRLQLEPKTAPLFKSLNIQKRIFAIEKYANFKGRNIFIIKCDEHVTIKGRRKWKILKIRQIIHYSEQNYNVQQFFFRNCHIYASLRVDFSEDENKNIAQNTNIANQRSQ
jgi:hypothetical protein